MWNSLMSLNLDDNKAVLIEWYFVFRELGLEFEISYNSSS